MRREGVAVAGSGEALRKEVEEVFLLDVGKDKRGVDNRRGRQGPVISRG